MLSNKAYLVLGIGTEVGKTFFVEKICEKLRKENQRVFAIKPIASGMKDDDQNSDVGRIIHSLGLNFSLENIQKITPWRFTKAASPNFAADFKQINFSELKTFCSDEISAAKKENSVLFIEAAGGVMTPINNDKTFLDLASELEVGILLVSANYLGSISHTLCAISALKSRSLLVESVLLNNFKPSNLEPSLISDDDFIETIKQFGLVEVKKISDLL